MNFKTKIQNFEIMANNVKMKKDLDHIVYMIKYISYKNIIRRFGVLHVFFEVRIIVFSKILMCVNNCDLLTWSSKRIFYRLYFPLGPRKAGSGGCGGAQETHGATCHNVVTASKTKQSFKSPCFFRY